MHGKGTTSTHQSLQRAIAILREFSELEPALTVTEMSRRLGLHKSTVSRILATLHDEGMVWHNADTGRYSLGMAVVEMAGVALGQINVRAAAMPHIERLVADVNETITVAVRSGQEAVTVAHLPSTHPIRHVVWIGRRMPLRTGVTGKVLLAAMHSRGEDWRALVGIPEDDRPAEGETTLAADLAAVIKRGYGEESDEFEIGSSAIAAPVLDHTGAAVAAISISGPSARFGSEARDAAAPLLIETANKVATDLGLRLPAGLTGSHR
jgi:DNA-binding IclR family transcriptional regulator